MLALLNLAVGNVPGVLLGVVLTGLGVFGYFSIARRTRDELAAAERLQSRLRTEGSSQTTAPGEASSLTVKVTPTAVTNGVVFLEALATVPTRARMRWTLRVRAAVLLAVSIVGGFNPIPLGVAVLFFILSFDRGLRSLRSNQLRRPAALQPFSIAVGDDGITVTTMQAKRQPWPTYRCWHDRSPSVVIVQEGAPTRSTVILKQWMARAETRSR